MFQESGGCWVQVKLAHLPIGQLLGHGHHLAPQCFILHEYYY